MRKLVLWWAERRQRLGEQERWSILLDLKTPIRITQNIQENWSLRNVSFIFWISSHSIWFKTKQFLVTVKIYSHVLTIKDNFQNCHSVWVFKQCQCPSKILFLLDLSIYTAISLWFMIFIFLYCSMVLQVCSAIDLFSYSIWSDKYCLSLIRQCTMTVTCIWISDWYFLLKWNVPWFSANL